jgi:hypothetical protein
MNILLYKKINNEPRLIFEGSLIPLMHPRIIQIIELFRISSNQNQIQNKKFKPENRKAYRKKNKRKK